MEDGIPVAANSEHNGDMTSVRPSFWRRHRWLKWTLSILLAVFVVLVIAVSIVMHRAEPIMRAYIVQALEDHFHSRVELDSFHVSVASGLWAEGRGLRIWPPAQIHGVDVPALNPDVPLISLGEFRFHAPLRYSPDKPVHISVVQLKGLIVNIPPKSRFAHEQPDQQPSPNGNKSAVKKALLNFVLDSIVCTDTQLNIESSKPGKMPLNFVISSLKLTHIKMGGTMDFTAQLINARPVGTIFTTGTFGPWTVDDPGDSPVGGQYTFQNANLGDFKGISGTLNSIGRYQGTLRNLVVDGTTDTPNFQLTHFGSPQVLHTQFHAYVDATNGDTRLDPVNATLGQSQFTVRGEIVRVPVSVDGNGKPSPSGQSNASPRMKGHNISLMVDVPNGRMEDFLRLVSSSGTPLLTGALTMKTSLDIPPSTEPIHRRIKLNGTFTLNDAQFTSDKIQQRIGELSLRGQGEPGEAKKDEDAKADVRSTMQSKFQMDEGIITLPDLKYSVPGADISLEGTYGVEGGQLNFTGIASMQATVSQMVGGWKGFLLKPADRFFKKNGAGTEVPIHINGTREHPDFGVDIKGVKHTTPQRPDQPN